MQRLKGQYILFSFWPKNLDFLIFSTSDWSQLDSAEAPTQQQIIAKYIDLFQCEVTPVRYQIDGSPQLELRVPIKHLDGVAEVIKTFFQGGGAADLSKDWYVLKRQLAPIIQAHRTYNPVIHFSPAAAAVVALDHIQYGKDWPKPDGYRSIKLRELRNGIIKPIVSIGRVPQNKVHEGGHFFRFEFDERRDTTPKRVAQAVLVDAYGVHRQYLYEGKPVNVATFTKKVIYAPHFMQKLPTYFRPRPPVAPCPPESHRMTFRAELTEVQRVRFETHLGRRTDLTERGEHLMYLDFSDVPDWVEMRSRLLAGENIAQDRQAYNAIVKRLSALLSVDFKRIFPSHDAMIFLGLAFVQDQGYDHPRFDANTPDTPVSEMGSALRHLARAPLTTVATGIDEIRLCGVAGVHPFIFEKRGPDSIHWTTGNVPYKMPTDDTHRDHGFALSYTVNRAMRRVWIEI